MTSHRGLLLLLAPLLCNSVSSQKSPDVPISSSGVSGNPRIEASGSAIYAAWNDVTLIGYGGHGSVGDVFFNRSLDGGATWLATPTHVNASLPSSAYEPEIAASGSSVYVVWRDERNLVDDVYFNRSLDGGATWLPADVRLNVGSSPGNGRAASPRIAAEGSSVFVSWEDQRNGLADIYFNRSLDGGDTWLSTDVRIDTAGARPVPLSNEILSSGTSVYVLWASCRDCAGVNPLEDVYINRSLDGGSTWLPAEVQVNTVGCVATAPRIAASGSSVYVTWEDHRSGYPDIYFNRSLDGGVTWEELDSQLNTIGGVAFAPQIAASESSIDVVWTDTRNAGWTGGAGVYFNRSTDSGATWFASDVRLDVGGSGRSSYSPQVATLGSSVCVVWSEDIQAVLSEIRFNRSLDGESWLTDLEVPYTAQLDSNSRGYVPRIAASGSSAYAVWVDTRRGNGASDIYFNLALGYQPYGQGTPGSGGLVPAIAGSGQASIGGTASIDLSNGLGRARGLLAFTSNGPAVIPSDAGLLLLQPTAHVRPFRLSGPQGVPGAGSASLSFEIPNDPSLLGTRVNFQVAIFDPRAVGRAALTRGLEMWIL